MLSRVYAFQILSFRNEVVSRYFIHVGPEPEQQLGKILGRHGDMMVIDYWDYLGVLQLATHDNHCERNGDGCENELKKKEES